MNQTKNTPLVISSRRAREKKVPLIGSSQSNIRNRTNQSPCRSGVRVRQTNNGCGQAYFFLHSPSPSPILNPSTSPLKSVFDSSQLSGSINIQDGGTTLFLKTIHGSRSKIRLLCRLTETDLLLLRSLGRLFSYKKIISSMSARSFCNVILTLLEGDPTYT